jgi:putative holliday junction resolvase
MRIMALDVGDARIGVAVSDPTELLATPLNIIKRLNAASDTAVVARLVGEQGAGRLIVGLPIALEGGEGMQAEKVRTFVAYLGSSLTIPIEMFDERFSTVTAREYMRESGKKKKGRARQHDDAIAAAVILQNYLDEKREQRG